MRRGELTGVLETPVMAPSPGEVLPGRARPAPLRREGPQKLTGTAKYTDDLVFPGAWYGATIRSTQAHARLLGVDMEPGFDWSSVVVLTARDIPGDNIVSALHEDQPALAVDEIRHHAEPIALIAAPDRATLRAAKHHVKAANGATASDLRPARVDPGLRYVRDRRRRRGRGAGGVRDRGGG